MSKNIYGWDTSQDSPILANQYSSDENNPENGEEDSNKSFYKRMMDYYKNNSWLQGLTSAAGGIAGAAIGGGYDEGAGGVFSAMQPLAKFLPGPWGAVASIGLGLGQRLFGYKLNKENVNKAQNNINQLAAFNSNVGSFDSLMANYNSAPGRMFFSRKDIGSNGLFNKGATKKYNSLLAQQDWADTRVSAALENNRSNLVNSQYANNLAHFTAYGGPINMVTTRPLSPFGNRFNYGGMSSLATHGADWNNGLKFINVGGSHEENPYEGVQMGVDQEGTPNLVEEGEVIWNDYVFSNRMTVPKRVKEKLRLKGMNNITYAEAAKKIQKEAEERPNDPISKRGLDAILGRLAYAQEEDRQKKQEEEQQQAIMAAYGGELATDASKWHAYGGELGNLFSGDGPYPNILYGNKYPYNINEGIYSPQSYFFNTDKEGAFPYEWAYNEEEPLKTPQEIFTEYKNKYTENKGLPFFPTPTNNIRGVYTFTPTVNWEEDLKKGIYNPTPTTPFDYQDIKRTGYKAASPLPTEGNYEDYATIIDDDSKKKSWWDASYLRYAPVIGSAINVFTDLAGLTNKPDYSNADSLIAATQNLRDVRPPSIGDYIRYTPFDRMFYLNQLNANAGATRRGLMDIAGGNRGAAMAGLLASDYNTLGKIGELARQAEEYNLANRFKTAEFNRGTNQFNSEMDLKAQMANNQNTSIKLDVLAKAAAIRDAIDARVGAARSANLTNFFDNLGNIGWEEANRNMTKGLYNYGINRNMEVYYTPYGPMLIDPERKKELDEQYKKANDILNQKKSNAWGGPLTYKRKRR